MRKINEENLIDENELLTIQCPAGHKMQMSFHDFEKGKRCEICESDNLKLWVEEENNPEKETDDEVESEPNANEDEPDEYVSDGEYYSKMYKAIAGAIYNIEDETNEVNNDMTIEALQEVLKYTIRMDQEQDILSWIKNETEDPNEIVHRLANRKHVGCESETCKYHNKQKK